MKAGKMTGPRVGRLRGTSSATAWGRDKTGPSLGGRLTKGTIFGWIGSGAGVVGRGVVSCVGACGAWGAALPPPPPPGNFGWKKMCGWGVGKLGVGAGEVRGGWGTKSGWGGAGWGC